MGWRPGAADPGRAGEGEAPGQLRRAGDPDARRRSASASPGPFSSRSRSSSPSSTATGRARSSLPSGSPSSCRTPIFKDGKEIEANVVERKRRAARPGGLYPPAGADGRVCSRVRAARRRSPARRRARRGRRRLVRGLERQAHRRGLGLLSPRGPLDEDGVRGRTRGRWHVPGAHLARRDDRLAGHRRGATPGADRPAYHRRPGAQHLPRAPTTPTPVPTATTTTPTPAPTPTTTTPTLTPTPAPAPTPTPTPAPPPTGGGDVGGAGGGGGGGTG